MPRGGGKSKTKRGRKQDYNRRSKEPHEKAYRAKKRKKKKR